MYVCLSVSDFFVAGKSGKTEQGNQRSARETAEMQGDGQFTFIVILYAFIYLFIYLLHLTVFVPNLSQVLTCHELWVIIYSYEIELQND